MQQDLWRRIFCAALEIDPQRRGEFIRTECGDDRELRERVEALVEHDDAGTTASGQRCIVIAYYEGRIAIQIASGLTEAHAHKIVHRGIKPSNIFLARNGLAKIADFGMARAAQSATSTVSATVPGTPRYMSPRAGHRESRSMAAPIFGHRARSSVMITGRRAAADVPATLFAIVHTPPPMKEVPAFMQRIIYRALAKRSEDRYRSAAE